MMAASCVLASLCRPQKLMLYVCEMQYAVAVWRRGKSAETTMVELFEDKLHILVRFRHCSCTEKNVLVEMAGNRLVP